MKTIKIGLILLLQLAFFFINAQSFEGIVLDKENNQPIAFAEVYFVDLQTGTTTDENGLFKIEHFEQKSIHLHISFIGYNTLDKVINISENQSQTFYLESSHYQLKEIIVSVPKGRLQTENIVSVEQKKISELQQTAPITLAEAISNIPGVEQNTTGTGIGKPVIRGLSGNRIVTYAQGIRIENQQWGDEHGLGIGEIGIESVEVIKGPASLLYGSDALGGVLFFVDERYAKHNTIEGFAETKFLSNSLATINSAGFKMHQNTFKFNLFGAYTSQADYQIPDFKRVFNTRFDEKNLKAALGFNTDNWISNIRYSYLQNNFGITEDAIFTSSKERNFILPFQTINNHNLSIENTIFTKESRLGIILGYTNNYRREFEDDRNQQALGMYLKTYTYNLKWNSPIYKKRFDFVLGTQGMLQNNTNNGEEILIPDAQITDVGAYALANANTGDFQFQTGIRFDNRNINTQITQNIEAFEQSYHGITFSGGAVYKRENTRFRANVSSGFRAPNTSELLSDGIHEGTNRYESGNIDLNNETATQFDFSFDYKNEHIQFSVNPFYNYIKNYIFLSPTGNTIDESPEFEYLQTNAYLYGGEMGVHYHPHKIHWIHLESNISMVIAEDKNKNPLPLIPQTKVNSTISAEFSKQNKLNIRTIYIQHIYKFKQDRINQFETLTENYSLINMGLSAEINTNNHPIEIKTGLKNLLNTTYIDHLSRFKNVGIANQGIGFYLGLKTKMGKK